VERIGEWVVNSEQAINYNCLCQAVKWVGVEMSPLFARFFVTHGNLHIKSQKPEGKWVDGMMARCIISGGVAAYQCVHCFGT